jgi:hypothetical protein
VIHHIEVCREAMPPAVAIRQDRGARAVRAKVRKMGAGAGRAGWFRVF